jgi:predicted TIM-barrel fold metal-dependent hydrolase
MLTTTPIVTRIIDTDTHFTEPPDLWTTRLPRSWGESVMHVRWDEASQAEVWAAGGHILGRAWGLLSYGIPRANSENTRPARKQDVHVATWDQAERVKVMDSMGIRTAVLYPNVAGLEPSRFRSMGSSELAIAHLRAYNDYQVEWAGNYPGRFVPMLVIPFWDLDAAVEEIERAQGRGFGGIVTTGAPQYHGEPFLADPHWDRLWSACVAAGLSVSFHIGNGSAPPPVNQQKSATASLVTYELETVMPPKTHLGYSAVPAMLNNGLQLLDLLLSGILVKHPALKFVSVESGLGWVPFVLEAADYHFVKARGEEAHPWGDLLPSDLFHRQVYVNYWFERLQPWHVELVGADNILFETDFPHRTCLEPADLAAALDRLNALPEDVREQILCRNAATLYNLDPS